VAGVIQPQAKAKLASCKIFHFEAAIEIEAEPVIPIAIFINAGIFGARRTREPGQHIGAVAYEKALSEIARHQFLLRESVYGAEIDQPSYQG
jgi:hypothetical protein